MTPPKPAGSEAPTSSPAVTYTQTHTHTSSVCGWPGVLSAQVSGSHQTQACGTLRSSQGQRLIGKIPQACQRGHFSALTPRAQWKFIAAALTGLPAASAFGCYTNGSGHPDVFYV